MSTEFAAILGAFHSGADTDMGTAQTAIACADGTASGDVEQYWQAGSRRAWCRRSRTTVRTATLAIGLTRAVPASVTLLSTQDATAAPGPDAARDRAAREKFLASTPRTDS
ncbi:MULTISPECIES: hypothetical protein [Streptomyces]|uniref:hypothetical protein n=1 Tax=Streptomyces TaxID=1883 RepID=UPI00103D9C75|nr:MULTISPECIES: hypothetical protein [Streptomyces]MBT3075033.1 hypothetical protein [Streptomyces sp. COG21]MBT3089007.1 hypothetical protein [Streptomyces sp. CYG21]MBT3097821.1 hypothetical protein [Streptomyces sp. CBG30]MBT3103861.1 hypothetical protein [Streptomyces sp. COG19]MBT3113267.1 hypothetical protein [Streptomyces sp. CYG20]